MPFFKKSEKDKKKKKGKKEEEDDDELPKGLMKKIARSVLPKPKTVALKTAKYGTICLAAAPLLRVHDEYDPVMLQNHAEASTGAILARIAAGTVRRSIFHTFTAPFERANIILQTQQVTLPSEDRFESATEVWSHTVRNGGFTSLWRGNKANLTLAFGNPLLRNLGRRPLASLASTLTQKFPDNPLLVRSLASYAVSASSAALLHPFYVARIRLGAQVPPLKGSEEAEKEKLERVPRGVISTLIHAAKSDGMLSLLRGLPSSIAAITIYHAVSLGLSSLAPPMALLPLSQAWMLSVGVHMTSVAFSHPFVVLSRRMMVTNANNFKNEIDCVKQVVATDGAQGLFSGFLYNMLLSFVGGALDMRLLAMLVKQAGDTISSRNPFFYIIWRLAKWILGV